MSSSALKPLHFKPLNGVRIEWLRTSFNTAKAKYGSLDGYLRKGLEAWYTVLIEAIWGKRRIMEVYLNVAETGIGTYGVEAGAQRYYGKSARKLSAVEAARIAAVLPLPKQREVNGAGGFTRRHGNAIARRVNVVKNGALDACVYK